MDERNSQNNCVDGRRGLGIYRYMINQGGEERGLTVHAAKPTLEIVGPRRAEIESHPTG